MKLECIILIKFVGRRINEAAVPAKAKKQVCFGLELVGPSSGLTIKTHKLNMWFSNTIQIVL